jgi:hypothetical protein
MFPDDYCKILIKRNKMKKLIILLAILFAYNMYAQNPYQGGLKPSGDVNITSTVIVPLEGGGTNNNSIEDVIKGQIRTGLTQGVGFQISGESGENVNVTFLDPTKTGGNVSGVILIGGWYLPDGTTSVSNGVFALPFNFMYLVTGYNATNASTTGDEVFELKVEYSYSGL